MSNRECLKTLIFDLLGIQIKHMRSHRRAKMIAGPQFAQNKYNDVEAVRHATPVWLQKQ